MSAAADMLMDLEIEPTKPKRMELRSAADIAANPIAAAWLLRPHLEEMVLGLMYGELGTMKSFLTLDMLLHIAAGKSWAGSKFKTKARAVVYVSAEGKGLSKRLQAWSTQHGVALAKLPFYAIERAIDLSSTETVSELADAIEELGVEPAVVAVDTLSRNCGALDENSTKDMTSFVNALDANLRQRLKCSVLLVHHTGHQSRDRARGSYSLMASTDANYRVERPDPETMTIKVSTGRLKDSDSPPPIYLEARVVNLGTFDGDGVPETSLVLLPTDERPKEMRRKPSGKQQSALINALEKEHMDGKIAWTLAEARRVARDVCGMGKSTAQSVVTGLVSSGFLKFGIGGLLLSDPPAKDEQA